MPENLPSDHDRIVTLESRMEDLRHWRETLTEHLDQKFDQIDNKIETRFGQLDQKMDTKIDTLTDHLDSTFKDLRDQVNGAIRDIRMALPLWAQIALYTLVGLLGILGGLLVWHP
jgi:DNA anti-recombination protein RmuC